jgi:putative endonuclease
MSRSFGTFSEDRAINYLQNNGFKIVDRNFYAKKLGEIDIIALKNNILHFIEVKSSRGSFEPIYNITPAKIRKIINSANYYLKQKKLNFAWCIDALIIKDDKIELIENITL